MALVNCRKCGHSVAGGAPLCPSCGSTYPAGILRWMIRSLLMIAVFVCIVIVIVILINQ